MDNQAEDATPFIGADGRGRLPSQRNARVYVVQQPMRYDGEQGCFVPKFPEMLEAAKRYGDIVLLTPTGSGGVDVKTLLPDMQNLLADFSRSDYLLLAGAPVLMAWAAAIAAGKTGGDLAVLIWPSNSHPAAGNYIHLRANLYNL